jgi:hypothetical protein
MNIYTLFCIGPVRSGEVARFQIRTDEEWSARRMAARAAGTEGREVWLDPGRSSCRGQVDIEGILERDLV